MLAHGRGTLLPNAEHDGLIGAVHLTKLGDYVLDIARAMRRRTRRSGSGARRKPQHAQPLESTVKPAAALVTYRCGSSGPLLQPRPTHIAKRRKIELTDTVQRTDQRPIGSINRYLGRYLPRL